MLSMNTLSSLEYLTSGPGSFKIQYSFLHFHSSVLDEVKKVFCICIQVLTSSNYKYCCLGIACCPEDRIQSQKKSDRITLDINGTAVILVDRIFSKVGGKKYIFSI